MSQENYMSGQANEKVVEGLTKVLADTFVLYFKTHGFHWNVEGLNFKSYHEAFEEQYQELWEVTDELAERIRALDAYAPTTFASLIEKSDIKEQSSNFNADDMVKELANDNTRMAELIFPVLRNAADAGDEVTVGMLSDRIAVHEKAAWMLRSFLK